MPLRDFKDSSGTQWRVWDVAPYRTYETNRLTERRSTVTPGYTPERRVPPDRRRMSFNPGLECGWLVFESAEEKRRISPPPEGWDGCPEPELDALCRQAEPVRKRVLTD